MRNRLIGAVFYDTRDQDYWVIVGTSNRGRTVTMISDTVWARLLMIYPNIARYLPQEYPTRELLDPYSDFKRVA